MAKAVPPRMEFAAKWSPSLRRRIGSNGRPALDNLLSHFDRGERLRNDQADGFAKGLHNGNSKLGDLDINRIVRESRRLATWKGLKPSGCGRNSKEWMAWQAEKPHWATPTALAERYDVTPDYISRIAKRDVRTG